jgi:signal transduction histidine kinase
MNIESYAGAPLWDSAGRPLGLLVAMSRRPLRNPQTVDAMLRIFAVRAATEIERARTEEALRASEAQLRQSQKMEAVGRLAGGIAHDFNNLLAIMTGCSEALLRRLGSEDPLRRYPEEIKKAGERAAGLTSQLLAFSRPQVHQARRLDLNEVVANMETLLRRLIGEHIELVTTLGSGLDQVQADPSQLEQVILNLAVNARDAMPQAGRLTIGTANVAVSETGPHLPAIPPGRYARLAVSDTGCGMDAETQARIFEPFFTTKPQGKGSGLGLSIIYGIVKQSHGYIFVDSEPGRGSTFTIYLPCVGQAGETLIASAKGNALRPQGR